MSDFKPPFEGQKFTSFHQWMNEARIWLTCHPEYNNTEHGERQGWRGNHFTAMCFDSQGRRLRCGGDMKRAENEGAFPVWWVWPDQIPELVSRIAALEAQNEWLKSRIAETTLPASKRDHDSREKYLLECGMPAMEVRA